MYFLRLTVFEKNRKNRKNRKKISQFHGKKAKKAWITRVLGAEKMAFENSGEKNVNPVKMNVALLNLPLTSVSCENVFSVFLKLWQQTAWFSWSTTLSRRTVVF